MNKKVAIFIDYLQDTEFRGGAEKFHYELLKGLSKNNKLDVYYFYNELKNTLNDNINLIPCDGGTDISSLINSQAYDAVLYPYMFKNNYISLHHLHSRYFRVKKVRKWYELCLSSLFERKKFRNFKKDIAYEKECLLSNKKIIVCSEILKRDFVESYQIPEEKIKVIYPGCGTPDGVDFAQNNIFTFALSALGFHKKGGFMTLFAAALLKLQGYDFKVKVIYSKWKKNILLRVFLFIFGLCRNFEFVGFQKNMSEFFKTSNCLLMPSNEETFGMTALEAMANKRFAIVSDCCGIAEILKDGENGFVFDFSKNPICELYKKMKYVLENKEKYTQICQKAYETAQEFSWEKTVSEFETEILS